MATVPPTPTEIENVLRAVTAGLSGPAPAAAAATLALATQRSAPSADAVLAAAVTPLVALLTASDIDAAAARNAAAALSAALQVAGPGSAVAAA